MKRALEEVGPLALNVMMLIGSAGLLWLLIALQRLPVRNTPSLIRIGLMGLLHPGLVLTLGVVALDSLPPGLAGLIQASQPAMIIVLAWLLLGERPARSLLLLTAVAGGGVVLVIGGQVRLGDGTLTAVLLSAAAAAMASLVLVLVAGPFISLIPVFSLLGGIFILGESLNGIQWLGALLVVGAITAISRLGAADAAPAG